MTRVYAVEPAAGGRNLAANRIAASPVPATFMGLDGQDLPLADESVDHALVTWTLCTIPDVDLALREIHRVLRRGGALHFVEHGRSPRPKVATWQDRLTPAWGKVTGGCHLNRHTPDLLNASGLILTQLQSFTLGRLEFVGHMYQGVATKH